MNTFMFDDASEYNQTSVVKDHALLTQQLDSLEISL